MDISRIGGIGAVQGQEKTTHALKKTSRALQTVLERLSTGQRINRAGDNAAGLGASEQLRSQFRGFKMAERNVTDALSALNIADGAANQMQEMLQRQRELALQANNATLTDKQRSYLDTEYQQLTSEIGRQAQATQFNRQNLTSGQELGSGQAQVQAGANAEDQMQLPQIDMQPSTLGVAGTSIATQGAAQSALTAIDGAIDTMNSQRATIGAAANQFMSTVNNLWVAQVNTQAAESVLRDQDMAQGITSLMRERLLNEGGTRAFARFNQISMNHLMGLLQ